VSDAIVNRSLDTSFGMYREDRVALVIDGPNLYGTLKALNRDADFKAIYAYFSAHCRLKNCNYYVALPTTDEYNPVQKLVDWLGYNGYRVSTKPLRQHIDEEGRRRVRGSMAVEMAIDMAEMAASSNFDRIVLFSGDTDLRYAIEAAQRKGTPVTMVTSLKSISDEVRWQADRFVEIESVLDIISKPSSRPSQAQPTSTTLRAQAQPMTSMTLRAKTRV